MRVSPYDFTNMPQDLSDFQTEVTAILNHGKYQTPVLIEGTPTWTGKEGETVYAYITSATAGLFNLYTYYFINSAWRWIIFVGATA